MTATDELRRMLDERGVKWMPSVFDRQHETFYRTENGVGFIVTEFPEIGRMSLACDMRITTEQAIEATLGSGTCHDSNNRFNAWQCSECGATLLLMFDDYDEPSYSVDGVADVPHYCPNCGRRVVAGDA